MTQKSERIYWFAAGLTHTSEVSSSPARRLCWSWLGWLSCLTVDWLSTGLARPLILLLEQWGSLLPLIFQQASPSKSSWQWQRQKWANPILWALFKPCVHHVCSHPTGQSKSHGWALGQGERVPKVWMQGREKSWAIIIINLLESEWPYQAYRKY